MKRITEDLRVALRSLARTPAFAVTAVLILGLGIGMSVAMLTVFDAVALKPLPVRDQEGVALLYTQDASGVDMGIDQPELEQIAEASRTIESVAAVLHVIPTVVPIMDGDRPVPIGNTRVTGNFFEVLGARAALGRLLEPSDDMTGAPPVVVLSYDIWRRQFGGDSSLVGRKLVSPYTKTAFTVVGIAPPGLEYPPGVGLWTPALARNVSASLDWNIIVRLAPGATREEAVAEFTPLIKRIDQERAWRVRWPGYPLVATTTIWSFAEGVLGTARPALLVMLSAVGLLFLMGCVNVGNLVALRVASRAQELAIRRSLGARTLDIARQMMVESGAIALAAGTLGLVLANLLVSLLIAVAPTGLPQLDVVRLAGMPLVQVVGLTVIAFLLTSLVPVVAALRRSDSPLRSAGANVGQRATASQTRQSLLVASQVALAVVMLSGAGLLVRTFQQLHGIDLGWSARGLHLFRIAVPVTRDGVQLQRFEANQMLLTLIDGLVTQIRALPGVTAVTPSATSPFLGAQFLTAPWQGEAADFLEASPYIPLEGGGQEYFATFGIPIVRGRGFAETDVDGAPGIAVLSESAAKLFWPKGDAIGHRIKFAGDTSAKAWRTVVGIAGDIRYRSLRESRPTVYLPWKQLDFGYSLIALRSDRPHGQLVPMIAQLFREANADAIVARSWALDDAVWEQLSVPRLSALLLSGFGIVAVVLAALGLYGIMSTAVRERTRELGIRAALGATPNRLRRDVFGHALMISGIGVFAGLVVALGVSRLLVSLLFEVSPADPMVMAGACALLLAISLAAAFFPARRATKVDPAHALRTE